MATMKRVVVTGGTGFIGLETLRFLLDRRYDVHVICRQPVWDGVGVSSADHAHYHSCDLLHQDCRALLAEIRPTHLLHLAWYAEHGSFWKAPENLDWIAASLRLLRAFAAAEGSRVVFSGSCAEYDWSYESLNEQETPLRPATLYGASKLALCQLLMAAQASLNISAAWGRIFFPYGPRDQAGRLLSTVIDGVRLGKPVACSDGKAVRSYIYVEDAARALVELLDGPVSGAVNIATDESFSVRDIASLAAQFCGNEALVRFGTRPTRDNEPSVLRADVSRLYNEVAFRPRFSIVEGIKNTVALRAS